MKQVVGRYFSLAVCLYHHGHHQRPHLAIFRGLAVSAWGTGSILLDILLNDARRGECYSWSCSCTIIFNIHTHRSNAVEQSQPVEQSHSALKDYASSQPTR
jgi:hypothetical protein